MTTFFFLAITSLLTLHSSAFVARHATHRHATYVYMAETTSTVTSTEQMAIIEENELEVDFLDTSAIKNRLLDLLPRMTGSSAEFRDVETLVNALEARYTPVQTLDFLNLAMTGDWQLLFSTNLSGGPKPNFRLRGMCKVYFNLLCDVPLKVSYLPFFVFQKCSNGWNQSRRPLLREL